MIIKSKSSKAALLIVLGAMLIACGKKDDAKQKQKEELEAHVEKIKELERKLDAEVAKLGANKTETSQKQESEIKVSEAAKNEAMFSSGAVLRCESVKDNAKSGNQFVMPSSGNKFVAVLCVLDNANGSQAIDANPIYFTIQDNDGSEYKVNLFGPVKPSFPTGDIPPKEKKKGWVTFEVPAEQKVEELKVKYAAWLGPSSDWVKLSDVPKK